MLKAIYKKKEDGFEQQFINQGEKVPVGWTANLDELDLEKELSEMELIKEENKLLKKKIDQQAEEITDTQMALAGVYEMVENLV